MKRTLLCLAALLLLVPTLFAQEKYYGVKSGIVKSVCVDGSVTKEITLCFDDYGAKQQILQVSDVKGSGSFQNLTLCKGDTMYVIDAYYKETKGKKRVQPNYLTPGPDLELTEIGRETILDKECTVYSYRQKQLLGGTTVKVWVWKGVVLKEVRKNGRREVVTEAVDFKYNMIIKDYIFEIDTYITPTPKY